MPGPPLHHVDDHGRKLVGHEIGDAFLLEADARAARRRHGARSRRRRSEHHVDGRDLAFGLDEDPARLGIRFAMYSVSSFWGVMGYPK